MWSTVCDLISLKATEEAEEKPKDIVVLQPNDITFVSEEAEKEYYESLK